MPTTYARDVVFNEADDDGMPPLVDNPNPSMTFTFATDMTPITYSNDPTSFEFPPENVVTETSIYSPPGSPALGAIRVSHAKKRDASYIPRPPNAFILFRSSFIKAQHIPGKIEGNHSALSKIIGLYWRTLPREEREVWEAKAIIAQAEHRKRFPDWRFRPGANALAKVKDGPRRRSNKKGRGEAEKEERSRDSRCAKIADLLVAGKKGVDLEAAIEEYDYTTGEDQVKKEISSGQAVERHGEIRNGIGGKKDTMQTQAHVVCTDSAERQTRREQRECEDVNSRTPKISSNGRFNVPLTAMFKRSSSEPVSDMRTPIPVSFHNRAVSTTGGDSFSSPSPSDISFSSPDMPHSLPAFFEPRGPGDITPNLDGLNCAASIQHLPLGLDYTFIDPGSPSLDWNEALVSPVLPAFEPDIDDISPAASPLSFTFDPNEPNICNGLRPLNESIMMGRDPNIASSYRSSYSSLKGWAGDPFYRDDSSHMETLPSFSLSEMSYRYDNINEMAETFYPTNAPIHGDWNGHLRFSASGSTYPCWQWNFAGDSGNLPPYAHNVGYHPGFSVQSRTLL